MEKALDLELIARLDPVASFGSRGVYEVLDHARIESVPQGVDLTGRFDLRRQSAYLLAGEVELLYSDGNRLRIGAGSEWAVQALGRRQPHVASATTLTRSRILRISDDMLQAIAERNQGAGAGTVSGREKKGAPPARLADSGVVSEDYLRSWPFTKLPVESVRKLQQLLEMIAVWDNEAVILENDVADYYYVIERGRARVSRFVGGVTMVLAHLKEGDAFGEEALVSGARRNATVTMEGNGILLRFKQHDFLNLMQTPLLRYMGFAEARQAVAEGAKWLDVRYPPEFRRDRLTGAINVPLNDVRNAVVALNKGRRYIAYCQDGKRSSVAAFILARAGFDVCVLGGGLEAALQSRPE